jgi:hypothetical protein
LLPVSTDTTFSIFWSQNENKLPLLAQIVRSVCCAPPTTVSSEQDFSMGSDIVTQKRNNLSDKRVECFSFLKLNLSREFSNESEKNRYTLLFSTNCGTFFVYCHLNHS